MMRVSRVSAGVLVGLALAVSLGSACFAETVEFPGKGSKDVWEHAAAHFNAAMNLYRIGKVDAAIAGVKKSIVMYADDSGFYNGLAEMYGDGKRDWVAAEVYVRRALAMEPREFKYRYNLIKAVAEQGRYREARELAADARRLKLTGDERKMIDEMDRAVKAIAAARGAGGAR